ncbi:MAG TPA: Gfo/Idh/MocA family oxidoreductase [Tepidisphaeraceae bacterium]|nr:Gfo/Idh/MocA family oxidoreductase [Tepidisphaeraceae bacterium]
MRNRNTVSLDRRQFLIVAAGAALAGKVLGEESSKIYTAAVIGHTGRGDYGHSVDQIFTDRNDVQLLALADPVAEGRAKAMQRSKALREYEDYRQMLAKERPQLVAIAPRWPDQRGQMCLAAIEAGAHLYTEKPFATDLLEADEILAAAGKSGRKIAVAHQTRLAPSVLHLKKAIDDGLIGELLQIDAWGKQDDRRAGGEDMLVLGTHLFDLMRFFAGNPMWCTARVSEKGRDITSTSGRKAGEEIGPVAGDEISALFAFPNSVQGSFTSRAKVREAVGHWGILLTGTKGTARVLNDIYPTIFVSKAAPFNKSIGRAENWQRVAGDPGIGVAESEKTALVANRRLVDDWIDAIRNNRDPICSGRAATAAIEMVMAVYQSAISGRRAEFPLTDRRHPLAANN